MALPAATRRVFLKRSLQAAGTLAVLPLAGSGCGPARRGAAPPGLAVLSPGEYAVLAAAADAFVPRGGAFELGASDVDVAGRVDALLADEDPQVQRGLRAALGLLEWAGGPLAGRFGRFSGLSASDRTAVLGALPHRFGLARDVYAGLKLLCLFSFYCADEVWPAIGYDGPWVGGSRA